MNFNRTQLCLLLLLATGTLVANKEIVAQEVEFSGFTTLGLTHSSGDTYKFRSSLINKGRDGFSFAPDSILGLQANVRLTDNLDAVGQVILQDRGDHSFDNDLELAFLRYQMNRNWSAKIGRFSTNSFLFTDYRYVGHLLTWMRPPIEMYSSAGSIGNMDGVQASYIQDVDFGAVKVALSYGQSELRNGVVDIDYTDITVFNVELQSTDWRVHAALISATLDNTEFEGIGELKVLDQVLPPIFAPFVREVQYNLIPDGRKVTYASLGGQYTLGDVELIAELSNYDSDWKLSLGGRSGYVSASYRIDEFTPYITFAFFNRTDEPEILDYDFAQSVLPAPLFQELAFFTAEGNENVRSLAIKQKSVSVGMKWDFADAWSFKMQLDHFQIDGLGGGLFSEMTPLTPTEKENYNVASIALTTTF
ncbi:porin [Glaciecola sp. MF2-115]|uniref:porin n=1 Tax=Glaciecola sp. MF2-115 TaxID=3384827 RepID=UPI00399F0888